MPFSYKLNSTQSNKVLRAKNFLKKSEKKKRGSGREKSKQRKTKVRSRLLLITQSLTLPQRWMSAKNNISLTSPRSQAGIVIKQAIILFIVPNLPKEKLTAISSTSTSMTANKEASDETLIAL